jgi:hypothetical protein
VRVVQSSLEHGNPRSRCLSSRARQSYFLSIYGSSALPCQVPGPVSLSQSSYFPSHTLRNTLVNAIHPTSLVPSLLPSSDVLPLRRCCHLQERPQSGARTCPLPPLSHVPQERKKKSIKKTFKQAFFFLFPQSVMGLCPRALLIPRTGQSGRTCPLSRHDCDRPGSRCSLQRSVNVDKPILVRVPMRSFP